MVTLMSSKRNMRNLRSEDIELDNMMVIFKRRMKMYPDKKALSLISLNNDISDLSFVTLPSIFRVYSSV
ncbi:hypothetical protein RIR_jg18535.t1 [Rhizophagus irregularis DAOM 181602=DAOM 197198]|nr:hypothetical protein RIR_jg18535.t1 [Rhizophagus irregularis DAOM 181602=DAOM 197198]